MWLTTRCRRALLRQHARPLSKFRLDGIRPLIFKLWRLCCCRFPTVTVGWLRPLLLLSSDTIRLHDSDQKWKRCEWVLSFISDMKEEMEIIPIRNETCECWGIRLVKWWIIWIDLVEQGVCCWIDFWHRQHPWPHGGLLFLKFWGGRGWTCWS